MTRSILLVEDDPLLLEIYTAKLLEAAFTVYSAPDAEGARRLRSEYEPELACIDARLPDGSGVDLAVEFEALGTRSILLTNDQRVVDAPPPEVTGVLLKIATPPKELAGALDRLLAAD